MDRQRSEARIAEVIAEMSVDVVALQELDLGRRCSAGADQTKMIAEQLGWYSYFHPAMRRDDEHLATPSLAGTNSLFVGPSSYRAVHRFSAAKIARRLK
jgi:endonuclease/exonuclease/phosphatase family metal-dependent hydrolase